MIASLILGIIDKVAGGFFENESQKNEFKNAVAAHILQNEGDIIRAQKDIIVSEAQGASWLQRNWRPLLMLVCIFIVANNYIFAPYIMLFTQEDVSLNLDQNIWDLMKLGVGGYIAGRSGEKIASVLKKD